MYYILKNTAQLTNQKLMSTRELVVENLSIRNLFSVRNLMIITESMDIVFQQVCEIMQNQNYQYKSFLGSNFPEDSEELHISKVISDICLNAENGISCIIRYLDDIYQTFYDLLNQNFIRQGEKLFCKISIGANSQKIQVHPHFKFIVIQDIHEIHKLDSPFIQRFEKQQWNIQRELSDDRQQAHKAIEKFLEKIFSVHYSRRGLCNFEKFVRISLIQQVFDLPDKLEDQQRLMICKLNIVDLFNFEEYLYLKTSQSFNLEEQQAILSHFEIEDKHINFLNYLNFSQKLVMQKISEQKESQVPFDYYYDNLGFRTIVYTHQDITLLTNFFQFEKFIPQFVNLDEIPKQSELEKQLDEYFNFQQNRECNLLIVSANLKNELNNYSRIQLVQQLIMEKRSLLKSQKIIKNVVIVLKLTEKYQLSFPFSSNWNAILIENLVTSLQVKYPQSPERLEIYNIKFYLQTSDFQNLLSWERYSFLRMLLSDYRMLSKALALHFNAGDNKDIERVICERVKVIQNVLQGSFSQIRDSFLEKICSVAQHQLQKAENPSKTWLDHVLQSNFIKMYPTTEQCIYEYINKLILTSTAIVIYNYEKNNVFEVAMKPFRLQELQLSLQSYLLKNEKIDYDCLEQINLKVNNYQFPFSFHIHSNLIKNFESQELSQKAIEIGQRECSARKENKLNQQELEEEFTQLAECYTGQLRYILSEMIVNQLSQENEQDFQEYLNDCHSFFDENPKKSQFIVQLLKQVFPLRRVGDIYACYFRYKSFIEEIFQFWQSINVIFQGNEECPIFSQRQLEQMGEGDPKVSILNQLQIVVINQIKPTISLLEYLKTNKINWIYIAILQSQLFANFYVVENYDLADTIKLKRHFDIFIKFVQTFIPQADILQHVNVNFFVKLEQLWKLWMIQDVEFYQIYQFYQNELISCLKIDASMKDINISKFQVTMCRDYFRLITSSINEVLVNVFINFGQSYRYYTSLSQYQQTNLLQYKQIIISVFVEHNLFEEDCLQILSMNEIEIENYQKFGEIFNKISLKIDEPLAVLIVYIIELQMSSFDQKKLQNPELTRSCLSIIESHLLDQNYNILKLMVAIAVFRIQSQFAFQNLSEAAQKKELSIDENYEQTKTFIQIIDEFLRNNQKIAVLAGYFLKLFKFQGCTEQLEEHANRLDKNLLWINKYFDRSNKIHLDLFPLFLQDINKTQHLMLNIRELSLELEYSNDILGFIRGLRSRRPNLLELEITLDYLITTTQINTSKQISQKYKANLSLAINSLQEISQYLKSINKQVIQNQKQLIPISQLIQNHLLSRVQQSFINTFGHVVQNSNNNIFKHIFQNPAVLISHQYFIPFTIHDMTAQFFYKNMDLTQPKIEAQNRWICTSTLKIKNPFTNKDEDIKCNNVFLVGDCGHTRAEVARPCSVCKQQIGNKKDASHHIQTENSFKIDPNPQNSKEKILDIYFQKDYIAIHHDNLTQDFKNTNSRSLIGFHIGALFLHIAILNSVFLNNLSIEQLCFLMSGGQKYLEFNDSQSSIIQLISIILRYWKFIEDDLKCTQQEEITFLLSNILMKWYSLHQNPKLIPESVNFDQTKQFDCEKQFEIECCQPFLQNFKDQYRKLTATFQQEQNESESLIPDFLTKEIYSAQILNNNIESQRFLINQLRFTKQLDGFEALIQILEKDTKVDEFRLLKRIIHENQQYQLFQRRFKVCFSLYQYSKQRFNKKITQKEALVTYHNNDQEFQDLVEEYNEIIDHQNNVFQCKTIVMQPIKNIDQVPLGTFLYSREFPMSQDFTSFLEKLLTQQNFYLNEYYEMILKENKQRLKDFIIDENSRRKSVTLEQLLERQIIQNVVLEEFNFHDFWMPQLTNLTGSSQFIDFESLEEQILKRFLLDKQCIDVLNSKKFQFKNQQLSLSIHHLDYEISQDQKICIRQKLFTKDLAIQTYYDLISIQRVSSYIEDAKKDKINLQTFAKDCAQDAQSISIQELYSRFQLDQLQALIQEIECNYLKDFVETVHLQYTSTINRSVLVHYYEEIIQFVIISINKLALQPLDGGKRFAKSQLSKLITQDSHKKQSKEKEPKFQKKIIQLFSSQKNPKTEQDTVKDVSEQDSLYYQEILQINLEILGRFIIRNLTDLIETYNPDLCLCETLLDSSSSVWPYCLQKFIQQRECDYQNLKSPQVQHSYELFKFLTYVKSIFEKVKGQRDKPQPKPTRSMY